MGEVKDFSAYTGKEEERSYQERIRKHRIQVWVRRVVVVAVIAAVIIGVYVSWRSRRYEESVITASVHISDAAGSSCMRLMNNILQYSKDGVRLMNASGEALWDQTYEMQNPIVRTCGDIAAIGDYNGHHIYVTGTSGPMGRIDTNLPIRDFSVASQGVVAAVLDDTDVTWIYLFDTEGRVLANFKTTMKDSGYPAALAISPSGELVCVSYVHPGSSDVKTSIAFFNFGAVGQNATDNYVSSYEYPGEVAPLVSFLGNKACFAVTDKRIMFYAGGEIPVSQTENFTGEEQVRSVFNNDDFVGLVFSGGKDGTAYRLQVYDQTGSLVLKKGFDIEYSGVLFDNEQITIYNENEFMIMDMKGDVKYEGHFEDGVTVMIPTSLRNRYFLVTRDQIQTMELN